MNKPHTFHIPVMGVGFTIDTPLKVAPFGIDSVISIGDDMLLEKLRKMYCEKYNKTYFPVTDNEEDHRAKRVTLYLNLIHDLCVEKFESLKNITTEASKDLKKYFDLLPTNSKLKIEFNKLSQNKISITDLRKWINSNLSMGSIDVNIMTKLDRENYIKDEKLPPFYNDAHAGLRGYANSKLNSSIIFSAGLNPRLYSYMENFQDFYPDENDKIKKKIVIKVSDYRSALIQGKFLAKKGLWVSEYRIESGLNCGGHAFATDGYLMGPILQEINEKRKELIDEVYQVFCQAYSRKKISLPKRELPIKITAQGGVGTHEEHEFLIQYYNVDSVGWGTPFLLVPEVTNVDKFTINQLVKAKEKDLYLSNISPIGIPFNSLRGNTKDEKKLENIKKGRPGSACPKTYLISNKEFTEKPICLASRQYQHLKIKELESKKLPTNEHEKAYNKIVDKSCICVGLGTSALLVNQLETKVEGPEVSICPGPNMAYFSKILSLKEMVDHIYGRINVIDRTDRPNMFVKELNLYLDYLKNKIEDVSETMTAKQEKYLNAFAENLHNGINYYFKLFDNLKGKFESTKAIIFNELELSKKILENLVSEIEEIAIVA